ncbi:MAG: type II toxin-antitoxin system RelE/ParE family toxin [Pyrinomonadaceae bacterium]
MTFRILKRPQAERDIEECFVYIGDDNVEIALLFILAVEQSLDELSRFPSLGKTCEFQNEQLQTMRGWHVKGYEDYLLFYLVNADSIELVRLLHSARDIDMLFDR